MSKQEQLDSFKEISAEVRARILTEWDNLTAKIAETMASKGDDYAGDDDRLSNFKIAGELSGISPKQQCLSLIATKVARLGTLYASGKEPNNEPTADSEKDLIVYSFLQSMLTWEETKVSGVEGEKYPFVKRGDGYVAHKDKLAELQLLQRDVVVRNGHVFRRKERKRLGVNVGEPIWVEFEYFGLALPEPDDTKTVHYIQRTPPYKGVGPGI